MKIIASGDWQCSLQNLDRCRKFVDQLVPELQRSSQAQSTFFIHLGDIKETTNPVDQRVTNFMVESVRRIKKACRNFLFVKGNHDMITTQDGVPTCAPVLASAGATVADHDWIKVPYRLHAWRPSIVRYALIYLVPYFRDPITQREQFRQAAEDARSSRKEYHDPTCDAVGRDNKTILAFHNTLTGCAESLYTRGTGYSKTEIGTDVYDYCIGGHIHIPQFIRPNIYYAGSPFAQDWSEVNIDHRFLSISILEDIR